jgi:hypothetical protein
VTCMLCAVSSCLYFYTTTTTLTLTLSCLLACWWTAWRLAELVWVQEEPQNMGAWSYVKPRFDTILREKKLPQDRIR